MLQKLDVPPVICLFFCCLLIKMGRKSLALAWNSCLGFNGSVLSSSFLSKSADCLLLRPLRLSSISLQVFYPEAANVFVVTPHTRTHTLTSFISVSGLVSSLQCVIGGGTSHKHIVLNALRLFFFFSYFRAHVLFNRCSPF